MEIPTSTPSTCTGSLETVGLGLPAVHSVADQNVSLDFCSIDHGIKYSDDDSDDDDVDGTPEQLPLILDDDALSEISLSGISLATYQKYSPKPNSVMAARSRLPRRGARDPSVPSPFPPPGPTHKHPNLHSNTVKTARDVKKEDANPENTSSFQERRASDPPR